MTPTTRNQCHREAGPLPQGQCKAGSVGGSFRAARAFIFRSCVRTDVRLAARYTAIVIVVVLVSGAALFATFDAHRSDLTETEYATVEERVDVAAAAIDDRLGDQQQVVAFAATDPAVADHGSDRQAASLAAFVETTAFQGVSVVDETGEVSHLETEEGPNEDVVGMDLSDREYVDRALAGDSIISDPIRAETGNYVVVISTPLSDDGEVVGTINGAYHLEATTLFEPLVADDEWAALTVEASGETLHSDRDRLGETIDARTTLDRVDWTVTIHHDRAELDGSLDRLAVFQGVLALALLGSFLGFGAWVYRSQLRHIGGVVDRLQSLRRREYEPGPALGGADEWTQIDDALRSLRSALARREQMLLVHNRILRHNLRNRLNVVAGRADELEAELASPHRENAAEISAVTDELLGLADRARMTRRLLEPSGPAEGATDITALVSERVEAASERFPALSVSVSAPTSAPAACGPELSVAIDELLANVAEHVGPSPALEVTVETDGKTVSVRIADDGPGIPADQAAVVTGDRELTQVTHTQGIGLWLANWIVERYGGRFRIPPSETGGVVEIELPASTAQTDDRIDQG